MVAMLGVDHGRPAQGPGRRASVEERTDLVGVDDVGIESREGPPDSQNESRAEAASPIETDHGDAHGLDLGGQPAGPLEAEHARAIAEPAPLADEVDHDPLQAAAIEGEHDVGHAHRPIEAADRRRVAMSDRLGESAHCGPPLRIGECDGSSVPISQIALRTTHQASAENGSRRSRDQAGASDSRGRPCAR